MAGGIASAFALNLWEQPVRRRTALAACVAVAGLTAADTPRHRGGQRVIYLGTETLPRDNSFTAMRESLGRLAQRRGVTVHLEHRQLPPQPAKARQAEVAAAAVASGCDALISPSGDAALAIALEYRKPAVLPRPAVVFASFSDPLAIGIVPSMLSPGGRITGIAVSDAWHGKRMELLREAFAHVRRVGVLLDRVWPAAPGFEAEFGEPARMLGLQVVRFDADTAHELDEVMHSAAAASVDAWYVTDSYIAWLAEARIIEHLRRLQRPAIHTTEREVAEGGALMAYAADRGFVFDTLADLTLRVLRGEDPGSIPIQRPRRFVLAVRPRSEPAVLRLHPSVIRRADRVY